MKKVLVSVFAMAALAGCGPHYDYYKGDIRYIQDGKDCIYYTGEAGNRFNDEIRTLNTGRRVVYRNTSCADLYARDTMGLAPRADRVVIVPVGEYVAANTAATTVAAPSCGCKSACGTCGAAATVRHKYVVTPAL